MFAWIRFVIMLTAVAISGQNEVQLSVQVLDEKGSLLPCRAWVEVEGQRFFEPTGPNRCTPYARDRSFSCPGRFDIKVPAGEALVHLERGKEYFEEDYTLALDQPRE
jgi:hypothetical protein